MCKLYFLMFSTSPNKSIDQSGLEQVAIDQNYNFYFINFYKIEFIRLFLLLKNILR